MKPHLKTLPGIFLSAVIGLITLAASSAHALVWGDVICSGTTWMSGQGVDVHYNQPDGGCGDGYSYISGPCGTSIYVGCKWQCVELAQRLYTTHAWYCGSFGVACASDIYGMAGMTSHANGGGYVPVPGDMIIWSPNCPGITGACGHVALVDHVDASYVYICEQNSTWNNTGKDKLHRSGTGGSLLYRVTGDCILGAVHSPNNTGLTDGASFVSKTVADGQVYPPGQPFTCTFTMKNTGTATWIANGQNGYTFNYKSGTQMGAPAGTPPGANVAPNATAGFSIPMTAPAMPGTYTVVFQMANLSATLFGSTASLQIVVAQNPPWYFATDVEGWTSGHSLNAISWSGTSPWPGVIYADQTNSDAYFYSPATSFAGVANQSVNVNIFTQGTNAAHDLQAFWITAADGVWNSAKSAPIVNYTAKSNWTRINLDVNNALWTGDTITQMRQDVDQTNHANRFLIDHILTQTRPDYTFPSDVQGWTAGNGLSAISWSGTTPWPGVMYADQTADDCNFIGPSGLNYWGANNDRIHVRVYPQGGTSGGVHDAQFFWKTTSDSVFTASKSSDLITYYGNDAFIDIYFNVGLNTYWNGNNNGGGNGAAITQWRLDFDQTNHATRWLVDSVQIENVNYDLPYVTTQPTNTTTAVGGTAVFSVVGYGGDSSLGYQWWKIGSTGATSLSGATASSLTITNAQMTDATNYQVTVYNGASVINSAVVTLTVTATPPSITTQPASQTVNQGQNATFSVVAAGTAPLAYQWRFNAANISGATASSYTKVNAQPADVGSYSVVVTNVAGTVTSANAVLTVNIPPSITTQPQGLNVNQNSSAAFSVVAAGTAPLNYQWNKNGSAISGATASSYPIASAQGSDAASYSVVVTNMAGTVTSANAVLTVNIPPSITTQPASQTVNQGQNAAFSVMAAGTAPLAYQWRMNTLTISGATDSSYTRSNCQTADAGSYSVLVTNVAGSITSADAVLTVNTPPTITTQPASQLASVSNNVILSVAVSGTAPLAYQWNKSGGAISGATLSSLTLTAISWTSAGSYSVVVTNALGSVTSANAILTVEQPVFSLVDGFESYNLGALDKNLSGGANTNASNPWWGPAPPNFTVYGTTGGVTPHGGTKMISGATNLSFCQEYYNLPYRMNAGSNYFGNFMFDWWFYDPKGTGSGASNYVDYMAVGEFFPVSLTNDFNTVTLTNASQRMSLGTYTGTGYNVGVYQARLVGATGGFNAQGWFNTATARTVGWHHGRMIVGIPVANSGAVQMFIDNLTNSTFSYASSGTNAGFNLIEINTSFGGLNTGGYYDDLTFRAANDPWIAQQPVNTTVTTGQNTSFCTVAVGTAYQWQFNSSNLSGATTTSLTITNAQAGNAGTYNCVITGANGTTNTSAVTLTVQ